MVHLELGVPPRVCGPEGGRQASLAEGVQAGQDLGLSVVQTQFADGTSVHEPEIGPQLLQPLLLSRQTLRLVLHDDHNVVIVHIFRVFIHFAGCCVSCDVSTIFPAIINEAARRLWKQAIVYKAKQYDEMNTLWIP